MGKLIIRWNVAPQSLYTIPSFHRREFRELLLPSAQFHCVLLNLITEIVFLSSYSYTFSSVAALLSSPVRFYPEDFPRWLVATRNVHYNRKRRRERLSLSRVDKLKTSSILFPRTEPLDRYFHC